MVFQQPQMLRDSVCGNVARWRCCRCVWPPWSGGGERFIVLERVGLAHPGLRTRRALSRERASAPGLANLGDPARHLLLLDEPTASLDPSSVDAIRAHRAEIPHREHRILMTTHNLGRPCASPTTWFSSTPAGSASSMPRSSVSSPVRPPRPRGSTSRENYHGEWPSEVHRARCLRRTGVGILRTEAGEPSSPRLDHLHGQSGLFNFILPIFGKDSGIRVKVVALGTLSRP